MPVSARCFRCCAPSVAGRCESPPSSRTALTSAKYRTISGWIRSHRASRPYAGRRCGRGPMRRWAMVSTLRQIGTRQPNRRRMMRSISASVGKGWQQRFCQRCGALLRPALLTGDACRKASGSWCSATARSDPDQWPLEAPNRCHTSPDAVELLIPP